MLPRKTEDGFVRLRLGILLTFSSQMRAVHFDSVIVDETCDAPAPASEKVTRTFTLSTPRNIILDKFEIDLTGGLIGCALTGIAETVGDD
jgi:hypothetical protein